MKKEYLSYITMGSGSSWGYGETPAEALASMLISVKDWTMYYKLSEWPIMSYIFDVSKHEGFSADVRGVFGKISDDEYTNEPMTPECWAVCITPKYQSKNKRTWSEIKAYKSALRAEFFSDYQKADETLKQLRAKCP